VWREVEEVVGDVLRGLSARWLVWGDIDSHSCGPGTRYAVCGAIVVEERVDVV
jgi:hypothetical protein